MLDEYYMDLALKEAREAAVRGEVPVGALLVLEGQIYSNKGNTKEAEFNPTAHAEVLALEHACESLRNWRLNGATLYVTVEPCLMCTGAIYLARVSKVVFGCKNPKGGAMSRVQAQEADFGVNHHVEIVGGVREMESARLLKDFFKARRDEKKEN